MFDHSVEPVHIPGYPELQTDELIIRLLGAGNYTFIVLLEGDRPPLVSKTLKYFEQQLPHFIRTSKSDLINPAYIDQFFRAKSSSLILTLRDETHLPVARRRIEATLQKIRAYRNH